MTWQCGVDAAGVAASVDVSDDEAARIDRELDEAIDKVFQARAVLGRAERMTERPSTFLELVDGARRLLREARSYTLNAESWLLDRDDPTLAGGGAEADRLAEKLECVYRPSAQRCHYHLTLLEPAPVSMDALRFRLDSRDLDAPCDSGHGSSAAADRATNTDTQELFGIADPTARLRRDQRIARGQAGFDADKPGLAPLVDEIDPRHYLRRQLAEARARIVEDTPARVQFRCMDCGMGPVFILMKPVRGDLVRLRFSHDNATWALLQRAPVPIDRLDPVTLLEPFVPHDGDPRTLALRGHRPGAAELAALHSLGTG
jgi:hypothetical protein